jgi:hypothetical protein
MRQAKRPFLIPDDPAHVVLMKWQAVGICCTLNALNTGVAVRNYTWPMPGTSAPPPIPNEALNELGEWHDEILSHLRHWKETRNLWERIKAKHV